MGRSTVVHHEASGRGAGRRGSSRQQIEGRHPNRTGYAPALAAFEKAKNRLRRTYDADGGAPSLKRLPLSNEMWAGYTDPIDEFIAANTRLTLRIQDPELRSAAEMLDAVSRQVETLGTMVRTGIISSLGGADSRAPGSPT